MAVTRARRNLWIVESDPEAASNMVSVWTSTANGRKSLVDVIHAGGAEVSSPLDQGSSVEMIQPHSIILTKLGRS